MQLLYEGEWYGGERRGRAAALFVPQQRPGPGVQRGGEVFVVGAGGAEAFELVKERENDLGEMGGGLQQRHIGKNQEE
jgi:hypothetical protein